MPPTSVAIRRPLAAIVATCVAGAAWAAADPYPTREAEPAAPAAHAAAAAPGPASLLAGAVQIPFFQDCSIGPANSQRHLATDSAGTVWAVAGCDANVRVGRSDDLGATWVDLGNIATVGGFSLASVTIEGGTLPGHAIVGYDGGGTVRVRTTTDFGMTWSAPQVLFMGVTPLNGLSIVAEGTHYHFVVLEFGTPSVRSSADRGMTWGTPRTLGSMWVFGDVLYDPATDQVEVWIDDPSLYRYVSSNHGNTFVPAGIGTVPCCVYYSDWALGDGRVVTTGDGLTGYVIDLATLTTAPVNNLPFVPPHQRSVDANATGHAYIASAEFGNVSLQKLPAASSNAGPPIFVDAGFSGSDPNVEACPVGDGAYVMWRRSDGQIWFGRHCFGADCCTAAVDPECVIQGALSAGCTGGSATISLSVMADPTATTFAWSSSCPGATFLDPAAQATEMTLTAAMGCLSTCDVSVDVSGPGFELGCTRTVTITDATPPVGAAGTIAPCHATGTLAIQAAMAQTSWTDACAPPVTEVGSVTPLMACDALVTVQGSDACGNAGTVTYVTRIDGTAPMVSIDAIAACFGSAATAEAAAMAATTAVDACPGAVTLSASTSGTCSATVTVTATDGCGNDATAVFGTRIDPLPPVLAPTVIASCFPTAAAAEAAALVATTATDDCGTPAVAAVAMGTCSALVRVTATDACGASSQHDYTTRIDGTPPALTAGAIAACYPTVAAAEAAARAATGATDACSTVSLAASTSGTCTATISVIGTDACGNMSPAVTYATRIDGTGPTLTAGTIAACYPSAAAAEAAALAATSASDACPGAIGMTASTSGTCSATVTVTATDGCGNSASVTYATRIDGAGPTVTAGTIAACYPSAAAAEAAALAATSASDACPGAIGMTASTSGTCSATVTVTATDGCGNSASVTYATRIDGAGPTVTAGTIAACYASAADAEAAALAATTASDACPGAVGMTASTSGTCSATVTVTATDGCGNSASVTYATRIDATGPTLAPATSALACLWPPNHRGHVITAGDIDGDFTLVDDCPGPITWTLVGCASSQPDDGIGDGSTTDDCTVLPDGSLRVRSERAGPDEAGRSYAVLVTAVDACGNSSGVAAAGTIHVPHDRREQLDCERGTTR